MSINTEEYPQLRLLAWNRALDTPMDESEALALYERNWSLIDVENLTQAEKEFIAGLVKSHGNGVLHV
jgi:hypothetical protein